MLLEQQFFIIAFVRFVYLFDQKWNYQQEEEMYKGK